MDSKTFIKAGEAFFECYQEAVNWEKATVLSAAVVKALALYAALIINPKESEKPDYDDRCSVILSEALQAALALNQHLSKPFATSADEEGDDGAEEESLKFDAKTLNTLADYLNIPVSCLKGLAKDGADEEEEDGAEDDGIDIETLNKLADYLNVPVSRAWKIILDIEKEVGAEDA